MDNDKYRLKNLLILFLLSFLVPGGGYAYSSRNTKLVLIYVVLGLIWLPYFYYSESYSNFEDIAFFSAKLASILLLLIGVVDVVSLSDNSKKVIHGNWRAFILIFLLFWLTTGGIISFYKLKTHVHNMKWQEYTQLDPQKERIKRKKLEEEKRVQKELELKMEMILALPKDQETFYNRFYLTFLPESLGPGKKNELGKEARLYIWAGSKTKVGDKFYVVSNSTDIISGVLTEIRPHIDDEFTTSEKDYKVGIIKWDNGPTAAQDSFNARVLVYHGDDFLPGNVGIIKDLPLPESEHEVQVGKHYLAKNLAIKLPNSNEECKFIIESWCPNQECGIMEDEGVLSCTQTTHRESSLMNIYLASDLNRDGIYEVLVNNGSSYGGNYEIRYLNNGHFLESSYGFKRKVLYQWAH